MTYPTPTHLPEDVAVVWGEMVEAGADTGPELEAYCGQVARLRDAQRRLQSEGTVIADPKGHPIPHPAVLVERQAQDEIRKWGSRFRRRRSAAFKQVLLNAGGQENGFGFFTWWPMQEGAMLDDAYDEVKDCIQQPVTATAKAAAHTVDGRVAVSAKRTSTRAWQKFKVGFFEEGKALDADPATRYLADCWLCSMRIDYTVNPNSTPDSHNLDHFYPVEDYPELQHDPANARHSHADCNASRGSRAPLPGLGSLSRDW